MPEVSFASVRPANAIFEPDGAAALKEAATGTAFGITCVTSLCINGCGFSRYPRVAETPTAL
jgi:hypothetical protein